MSSAREITNTPVTIRIILVNRISDFLMTCVATMLKLSLARIRRLYLLNIIKFKMSNKQIGIKYSTMSNTSV